MPPLQPVSRRELIRKLRQLGFEGPLSGGNHEYMIRHQLRLFIPNPHKADVSGGLLHRILKQAGISREEWEQA